MHYHLQTERSPLDFAEKLTFYTCLLAIERDVSDAERDEISENLVASGCIWMLAWGKDGTLWDDSVDYASMERFPDYIPPDDQFVMTTWHDDQTLEDVLEFAYFHARISFDDVQIEEFLVLHLAENADEERFRNCLESISNEGDRDPASISE